MLWSHPKIAGHANMRRKNVKLRVGVQEVIPSLLHPYMRLLRTSQFLRSVQRDTAVACSCGGENVRSLKVTCVYFDLVDLKLCKCSPSAQQLVNMGLFPCAPLSPSLAVDISLLQFTQALFVRLPPNTTSFCDTLEYFLECRGYKLTTRETLHRRFGNSLLWYSSLTNSLSRVILDRIGASRRVLGFRTEKNTVSSSSNSANISCVLSDNSVAPSQSSTSSSHDTACASEYLRRRCPLLQTRPHLLMLLMSYSPGVIVCVDACFTQKHRKGIAGGRDPPRAHPETVFIPEEDVKFVEAEVNRLRAGGANTSLTASAGPDVIEPNLKVPNSVLDGCNDSFKAADECRQKASTQFFADTGLMAMLCRHDRVLWLVNMTSAGEKQHYAISLLHRLFEHLPPHVTVGLLYDIACQLHRSIEKWSLLGRLSQRIVFGISVFHAFGHQWPCQVVYHPRKCTGFGLSDGEGCERFWSSIQRLIPSLRVSGYHQRLFVIDTQVKYNDQQSLRRLGRWLRRKWYDCQHRLLAAKHEVEESGLSAEDLRAEWLLQVQAQTKPIPRQSKNHVAKTVEAILALQKSQASYDETIRKLEAQLLDGSGDPQDLEVRLGELRTQRSKIITAVLRKRSALGVNERAQLSRLSRSKFLQLRLNARALKQRIRDRLRQRKFELDRLERSYRQTTSKHKLSTHVESAVKRREPGILKLAQTYNGLCKQMADLVKQHRAPVSAIVPEPIRNDGLFKLDVDDTIWQDVGLGDEDDDGVQVPRWLGDESVRSGIKAQLLVDRCTEESNHLSQERCAMQLWMQEEWASLEHAIAGANKDEDLLFQLEQRQQDLCRLCVTWKAEVDVIPCAYSMHASWGPSEHRLHEASVYEVTESVDAEDDGDDDGDFDYGYHDSDSDTEGDLLDVAEAVAITDAYHAHDEADLFYDFTSIASSDLQTVLLPTETPSPKKRKHM
ncbi:hypothetical protein FOMPIDRAFT_128943 [Fomitopsis schrenkii]|uniref:CxC1-like cysteine cluster associated with KDZ transposases domain-containing protein n=1 Tax=Fomitopsis schrenkii TaxID=2126942 RepID=S8DP80_FOMSC|nr:hypothetical protein FOMPIDRAFT_128943 [Fomitopsis schrenkii]